MAKPKIQLFGAPKVTQDEKPVDLGVAIHLLAALILWRDQSAKDNTDLAKMLIPKSAAEDPRNSLSKQKKTLRDELGLKLPSTLKPSMCGQMIADQIEVDVVEFDEMISSANSQDVMRAIERRQNGPLLFGWPKARWEDETPQSKQNENREALWPKMIMKEREVREQKYREALWKLIIERDGPPEEARSLIKLLLNCNGVEESRAEVLHQRLLKLDIAELNSRKDTGSDKTTWEKPLWRIPSFPTELLGREEQMEAVQNLLAMPGLVTLIGTAGVGKTRLAAAVAKRLADRLPDGAAFVDLTTAKSVEEMDDTIRAGLGLMQETGRPLRETLLAFLEDKHLLLVWDNCEHLAEVCKNMALEVLRRCPTVRLLVTSRETLHLDGERLFPVPVLTDDMAVRLFEVRAQDVKYGFQITSENRGLVLKICRALDNLPLAIRLAAALVASKKVPWIADHLDKRFALLVNGPHGSSPHHVSLQAAFDLSYSLLTPAEQSLFRTLGVFSGSFSSEAVASVAATPDAEHLLRQLDRKSLVTQEESGDEMRYRLLASVQQYAEERLQENGEWEEVRRRHRDFFLVLAEEAEPQLRGPEQKQWLDRLETEQDNFRATLAWRADEAALCLACALSRFWWVRGYAQEGRQWLARDTKDASDQVRAKALIGAGRLAYVQGKFQEAKTMFEESLALRTHLKDKWGIANAWHNIGDVAFALGEYETAWSLFQDSLSQFQDLGDKQSIAGSLIGLGMVEVNQGQYLEAKNKYKRSLELQRELNFPHGIADALRSLSNVALRQGELIDAREFIEESLEWFNRLDNKERIAECQIDLGRIALAQGNSAEAKKCFDQSLTRSRISGQQMVTVHALNYLASIAYEQCDYEGVRRLFLQSLVLAQRMKAIRVVTILTVNLGLVTIRLGRNSEGKPLISEGLQKLVESQDKESIASILEQYAAIIALQGQNIRAVKLWGASAMLSDMIGFRRPANEDTQYNSDLHGARTTLGQNEFDLAWAEGQAMTWQQAVAYALEERVA